MTGNGILIGQGLRAEGVLVHAPAPLGSLWIPLTSGLTVLYGRNGVGKTQVLNAISSALHGIALPVGHLSLHLSPADDNQGFDHSLLAALEAEDSFDVEIDETLTPRKPLDDFRGADDSEELDERFKEATEGLRSRLRKVAEKVGLAEGLCHTPRLALVATGDLDHPMWKPMVSVVPTELAGFVTRIGLDSVDWNSLKRSDIGVKEGEMVFSLAGLRRDDGWLEGAFPVNVQSVTWKSDGLFGDRRDDGLSAKDVIACLMASDRTDIEQETLAALRRLVLDEEAISLIEWADSTSFQPHEVVAERLDSLSSNATLALQHLTGDRAAEVRAELRHPNLWIDRHVVSWTGTDGYGSEVPIAHLGAGATRWARLAISLALTNADVFHPAIVMIDEPERALHSAAQQRTADSIAETIRGIDMGLLYLDAGIVATHSPAFLALPDVNLVHVSRGTDGTVALDAIDTSIGVEGLTAQLGISRADALLTTRWFVFVEGDHDAAILQRLFGEELSRRHAILRTMHGASNVEAHLNTEFLLTYSDAKLRVILDNIGSKAMELWNDARGAASNSDPNAASRALHKLERLGSKEAGWLFEAGTTALRLGHLHRIELVGLERHDIINYLPVRSIVSSADSWNSLSKEWHAKGRPGQFKAWLKKDKGATFDAASLAEIAATLTDYGDLRRAVDGL